MFLKYVKRFLLFLFSCFVLAAAGWLFLNRSTLPIYFAVLQDSYQMVNRVEKLKSLGKPIIAIFGGHRTAPEDYYYKQAAKLTELLIKDGKFIMTGGGSGIMAAANDAAHKFGRDDVSESIAVNLYIFKSELNLGIEMEFLQREFFARNFIFVKSSAAYVYFPGGVGTAYELFEIVTLMSSKKIEKKPIILFDSVYWKTLMEWVKFAVSKNLISQDTSKLIKVFDTVEEIAEQLHGL